MVSYPSEYRVSAKICASYAAPQRPVKFNKETGFFMLGVCSSRNFFGLILLSLSVSACAAKRNNFSHLDYQLEPSVQVQKDPNYNEEKYRTFTLIPQRVLTKEGHLQGIAEKQVIFLVRNFFEKKGFVFVEPSKKPDLLISVDALTQYKEHYVPPQQVTVPKWVQGETYTTTSHHNGSLNMNAYDSYGNSAYGNGSYSGTSTSYTTTPGYMTTESYTRPGYTQGFWYPTAMVNAYDLKTKSLIWQGIATGTTSSNDVRATSQGLFLRLAGQFPNSHFEDQTFPKSKGAVGILALPFSRDGNSYFPTAFQVVRGTPAYREGIEELDMIISVDGKSTENMPILEFYKRLGGEPDTDVKVSIQRLDKIKTLTIRRAPRDEIIAAVQDDKKN